MTRGHADRPRLTAIGAGDRAARRRSDFLKASAGAAALLVVACGFAGWAIRGGARELDQVRDAGTLCLERHPAPQSILMALDVTDRLADGSGQRFADLVREFGRRLPRDARFTIVPFDGDLSRSLTPAFDLCSPGRGAEADEMWEGPERVEREYRARFGAPLGEVAARLRTAGPGTSSPITLQLERMVGDPAIPWRGAKRRLVLFTDGLQFTTGSPVYSTGRISLPAPRPGLLKDVDVDFVELVNPRHPDLQTPQMRQEWERWFRLAGAASVTMYAPGYPPPAAIALR